MGRTPETGTEPAGGAYNSRPQRDPAWRAPTTSTTSAWRSSRSAIYKRVLEALTLFCHAAEEEEVGAEWTRSLIKFLYRAQHNPQLRFET